MSDYDSKWHEQCCGRCVECGDQSLYKRFVSAGPVRYGVRVGAVSPPPPGAGPRYRTTRCWSTTPATLDPVSRVLPPINSSDVISCANRTRMSAEHKRAEAEAVCDDVLHSTRCFLANQLKRYALVRPPVYARFTDNVDDLDRLPRFRFGGNRANASKRTNCEQRLRELSSRLKREPVPPPRIRHSMRLPQPPPPEDPLRVAPYRSASFSQVDYSADDKKYIRKRELKHDQPERQPQARNRTVSTLPRSKDSNTRCIDDPISSNSEPLLTETNNLNQLYDMINKNTETSLEKDLPDNQTYSIVRSTNSENPRILEKKRDKSRRRKGIYISQWPNTSEEILPKFNENEQFEASLPEESSSLLYQVDASNIQDDLKLSNDEQQLSSEENAPSFRLLFNSSENKDKNNLLIRIKSFSEEEPDHVCLEQLDTSDCESRISLNNDPTCISILQRYPKRPLRGPYGQMLEAEMKKPETERKNQFLSSDLKFLEDISLVGDLKGKNIKTSACNTSLDETYCKGNSANWLCSSKEMPLSKRKVSADSLIIENEQRLVVSHQRTISSPSKLEGFSNAEVSQRLLEQLLRSSSEQFTSSETNLLQKNDTRTHVVVELYDNEKTYVESLQILVTKYLEPLKNPENSNLLDLTLVDEIFYQIPFLLTHHLTFLDELKKRLETWDLKQKIGDVFLEMFSKSAVIESYTNYVNNSKRARDIIKTAQQSKPAFAKFLETTAREHKGKLALDSLLIKPVQKFPKYELLLQRLIQHTDVSHPDHSLLLAALKEVHDKLLQINCTEREALEQEQLREIEGLIEGLDELVSSDRQYLRHDLVSMVAGGGARKERALFLFTDLILVTSIKRRSGTIRRPTTGQGSVTSTLEANKYKLLMKIILEDLEIVKSKDNNLRQIINEIENISNDVKLLNNINELSWSLHCNHAQLDDVVREMLSSLNKQLIEQQSSDSQLSCLDLTLNTANGLENISIVFSKPEKRSSWEESFIEAKNKLAVSGDQKTTPELFATVPIRKTRSGLQFTCAAPTLGDTGRDVWVCNSDGYVGQVCILSLQPEPTVTSCNGVCSARILCITSVPGINNSFSNNEKRSKDGDKSTELKSIQFDSSSSSDEEDGSDIVEDNESLHNQNSVDDSCLDLEDMDNQQSTIWLGTEDGCIHVYNSSDNIRIKKHKLRLQHGSAILSIIYLENRVFIALANGDVTIYDRDIFGGWNINAPTTVTIGSTCMPVSKMLANGGKLWCGSGSMIKVVNTQTYQTEHNFTVNDDCNKPVSCIVLFGNGLWLVLQNSAIVKCFHTLNFELLCEVNVAPAVTKMLTSCDDIIRQHKAACLRVTSLLACKDLLWIGTSAGVILTMPLPHITQGTVKLAGIPLVSGVSHGHTGHVRFLTYVELNSDNTTEGQKHRNSYKGKMDQRTAGKLLVISGGDGYEDFRGLNLSEVAGREDSTNHLLLWNI